MNILIKLKF